MKRNEILGEHKKGTKAVKYNKKPKDHTTEFGKAKEKLAPVKPMEGYNPNSVDAQHRREIQAHHEKEIRRKAETGDADAKKRLELMLKHKERMANDYNDRMEREGVEEMRDRRDAYQRDYDSSVSGMGKRQSRAYQDDGGANDERHDLDPSEWYIVKDGKMFKVTVYPNQEQEARARGYSPSREQARARADADTRSTDEAMGAEVGKITKVDPATKKATLTKPDGSSMEVDSTALKPTPDGKMQMDTPDIKTGTSVVSTENSVINELDPPPNDSTSPITGDNDHDEISKLLVHRLKRLAGM